jgi:purine-binding chemotaxis protein CheW
VRTSSATAAHVGAWVYADSMRIRSLVRWLVALAKRLQCSDPMDRSHSALENPAVIDRLVDLEREVALLRRQVQEPLYASSQLPNADFRALRFRVSGEEYGVPVGWVREIVRYVALTSIADAPHGVAGAINLRGEVLPVLDTRVRLGMSATAPNLRTSIVLLAIPGHAFGILVDAVIDVSLVPRTCLSEPNATLTQSAAIKSVATLQSGVLQLLDIARLLTRPQWEALPTTSEPKDES